MGKKLPPVQLVEPEAQLEIDDNAPISSFASAPAYPVETLEVHNQGAANTVTVMEGSLRSVPFSRRKAVLVSMAVAVSAVVFTGAVSALFINKDQQREETANANVPTQDITLGSNAELPASLQGGKTALYVNGDLITAGDIKVTSGNFVSVLRSDSLTASQTLQLPDASGTVCLDINNCNFATQGELTQQADLNVLQTAQINQVQALLGQIVVPPAGVTSLNSQNGAVSVQGSTNRISVATANGVLTLTTPQDLDSNANVQFGNLTLGAGGQVVANTFTHTGSGSNIAIDAGTDTIVFTSAGRTFQLPAAGGASQTICTTTVGCAGGGSGAVTDVNGEVGSITIQGTTNQVSVSTGMSVVTLSTPQNIHTGASPTFAALTLSGLGSGNLRASAGVLTVGAVNLGTEVTSTLGVGNGGTGLATTPTNGQLLIGNGTSYTLGTIGNNGGLTVTNGAGSIGLAVNYGSSVNTAVQGNVSLTCPSGTGNLSGGGNSITLGAGGSCNSISIVSNPTFSTSVTTPSLVLTGAGNNGTLQVANLGQATTYTLPDPGTSSVTICLSTGNCAGSGGGVTGSGTNNRVAKFTSTGSTIGDSNIYDDGTNVGIGAAGSYPLDVVGDVNTSTQYRIGGTVVCTSSGCSPGSGSNNYVQLQGSTPGSQQTGSFNISGTGIIGTALDTSSASFNLLGSATTINMGSVSGFSLVPGGDVTIPLLNSKSATVTSDLSGGARSTSALTISQANDASNNSSASLLTVINSDTGSTAAAVTVTQAGVDGTGISASAAGTNGIAFWSTNNSGFGFSASGQQTGFSFSTGSSISTGIGYNFNTSSASLSTGSAFNASGTTSGTLTSYTGNLVNIHPARTHTGATAITDSGNLLNITRDNTVNNGGGTFNVTGALASLQSNCTVTSGACADSGGILSLNQQYASATGAVLNVQGAGTGNLGLMDASNASANGLSIDVQSNAVGQYALSVTSNNGGTTGLYVRADGNVGIGTAAPSQLLDVAGNAHFQGNITTVGTYNTNTFASSELTFGANAAATVAAGVQATSNAAGNDLLLRAGDANGVTTGNTGGHISLVAGSAAGSGAHDGGTATVRGGLASGTGTGGSTFIQGGFAAPVAGSTGGSVAIEAADGSSTGTGGVGGAVTITGGDGLGSGANNGGSIVLQGGVPSGAGIAGAILLQSTGGSVGIGISGSPAALLSVGGTTGNLTVNSSGDISTAGAYTQSGAGANTLNGTLALAALGTADTSTALCRNSSNQVATCTGGGGTAFLQGGNSFGAAGDLGTNDTFALNFRTDNATRMTLGTTGNLSFSQSSTIAPIQIGSSAAGYDLTLQGGQGGAGNNNGGNLLLQGGAKTGSGTGGAVIARAAASNDLVNTFDVQDSSSSSILKVDTINHRVGVNLGGSSPTIAGTAGDGRGLEVLGSVRISGAGNGNNLIDKHTSPNGFDMETRLNIQGNYTMTGFSTLIATSVGVSSADTAMGLTIFDARTIAHYPTIGVESPDESGIVGFNWNGSSTSARIETNNTSAGSTASKNIILQSGDTSGASSNTGTATLKSGNATSGNSGNVVIDSGTASGTTGTISVGTTSSRSITVGNGTGATSVTVNAGTGGVSLGSNGVANTLQFGNTSGAVAQTINIGNNSTASSTNNINIGSSIAGTTAVTGTTTITNRSGSSTTLNVNNSTSTGNILNLQDNGTTVMSVADGGAATFQNSVNSVRGFQVQDSAGTSQLNVNTYGTSNNIWPNPSFEANINGVYDATNGGFITRDAQSITPKFGRGQLYISNSNTVGSGVEFRVAMKPSTQYSISFWAGMISGSSNAWNVGHNDNGSDSACLTNQSITTTYTQFTCTFTTGSTMNATANVYLKRTDTAGGVILVDGVTIVPGATALTYTVPAAALQVDTFYNTVSINGTNSPILQPWQLSSAPLPNARSGAAITSANGYIYVAGGGTGVDGTSPSTSVYYTKVNADGSLSSWSTANSLGTAIYGANATVVNNYIYVIGGKNSGGTSQQLVQYAKLNADGSTGTWSTTTNVTTARFTPAVFSARGYIYVAGGYNTGGTSLDTVYYAVPNPDGTISSWTSTSTMAARINGAQAVVINGYAYIIGGLLDNSSVKKDVQYAKINSDGTLGSWTNSVNILTVDRADNGSVALNGYIYSMSGWSGGASYSNTIDYVSPSTNGSIEPGVSTNMPTLPRGFNAGKAVTVNGYIYYIGGDDGTNAKTSVYYTSGPRLKVAASLDLVGSSASGGLNERQTGGGNLTAGNTTIAGMLQVFDAASFLSGVSIEGGVRVTGQSLFQNKVAVNTLTTADSTAQLTVSTNGTGNKGFVVQGVGSQSADLFQAQDSTGAVLASITAAGNLTVKTATISGHIITGNTSGSTTIAKGAAADCAGTGSASISGNDTAGTITVASSTGACSAGVLATVTFSSAFGAAPRVILTPANINAPTLQYYNGTTNTTTFTLDTANAAANTTTYIYNYHVLQ